jgi:hypothetical protein
MEMVARAKGSPMILAMLKRGSAPYLSMLYAEFGMRLQEFREVAVFARAFRK